MTLKQLNKKIIDSGLMQKHIAKQIGIERFYLNSILRGKRKLTDSVRIKLETYLS